MGWCVTVRFLRHFELQHGDCVRNVSASQICGNRSTHVTLGGEVSLKTFCKEHALYFITTSVGARTTPEP